LRQGRPRGQRGGDEGAQEQSHVSLTVRGYTGSAEHGTFVQQVTSVQ
jgi:hypothetical protein